MPRKIEKQQNDNLQNALPLFHYMLGLFHQDNFESLVIKAGLRDSATEGVDDREVSRACTALTYTFLSRPEDAPFAKKLHDYDSNIVRFTKEINHKRTEKIQWKYFQYLILLFTEIYLDNYFSDPKAFTKSLNSFESYYLREENVWKNLQSFSADTLNKLAFWCATGSGKTLLMHVQIKQFLHYAEMYGLKGKIDNILLITPSRELSLQHLAELKKSSIPCEIFSKGKKLESGKAAKVEIIEITKFKKDNTKPKQERETVPVEAFEGHNLVLVDEAHKGSGGDEWLTYREKLTNEGFSFEYSATFGQAIGALSGTKKTQMLNTYGLCTLFDYSYRYFYKDGYGKDYRIMNMDTWQEDDMRYEYLTAYLLTLYEQKLVYEEDGSIARDFLIANPLGVFVGAKVNSKDEDNEWIASDVLEVILFLNDFLSNRDKYSKFISKILNNDSELVDGNGVAIFKGCFTKLHYDHGANLFTDDDALSIYLGILDKVFNNLDGGKLHIDQIISSPNELALRLGNSDSYFGLVYVGKTDNLRKRCKEVGINVGNRLMPSLFKGVTRDDSSVNILIGAKMFAEGWSSWRVSVMGLMRFGRKEGSMIIQMFGRGVRLKGYGMSLKRSSMIDDNILPEGMEKPRYIRVLETLNVFGVSADYMELFKQYLSESGLSANDSGNQEYFIKTVITAHPDNLKLIREDKQANFLKDVVVNNLLDNKDKHINVVLDWYPTIKVRASENDNKEISSKHEDVLSAWQLRLINWDKVYFAIEHHKVDKRYYNLEIGYDELKALMGLDSHKDPIKNYTPWYTLLIPERDLQFTDFAKDINRWQQITIELLKLYIDKFYRSAERHYYSIHQKVEKLKDDDEMLVKEYSVNVGAAAHDIEEYVKRIKEKVEAKDLSMLPPPSGKIWESETLVIDRHLYNPLFYFSNKYSSFLNSQKNEAELSISPVPLNDGERQFVNDLQKWLKENTILDENEVFLLRNPSKAGLGFFVSGGFFPDFILWINKEEMQYLTFIDPKGIRNLRDGLKNEKVQLYHYLDKDVLPLKDEHLKLNSFIISDTKYNNVIYPNTIEEYNANHVYFQKDQKDTYIDMMIDKILHSVEI